MSRAEEPESAANVMIALAGKLRGVAARMNDDGSEADDDAAAELADGLRRIADEVRP